MYRSLLLSFFLFPAFLAPGAENLISNSSFELKDADYGVTGFLHPWESDSFQGVSQDAATAVHGNYSICLVNRKGEQQRFMLREVRLKPDRSYTFSIWLKSDTGKVPVSVQLRSVYRERMKPGAPQRWFSPSRTFLAEKEWKRCSFTFRSSPPPHEFYFPVLTLAAEGRIHLDAVQLEEGESATEYAPSRALECAAVPLQEVFTEGEEVRIELRAVNAAKEQKEWTGTLEVRDVYTNDLVLRQKVAESVEPDSVHERILSLPLKRFGSFTVELKGTEGIPGFLTRVGKLGKEKRDLSTDFCVGVNGGGFYMNAQTGRHFLARNGKPEEFYRLLSLAGVRLLRLHDTGGFDWASLEPAPGKFDFTLSDQLIRFTEPYGIQLFPVLGYFADNSKNRNYFSPFPKWLRDQSPVDNSGKASWFNRESSIHLPPQVLWRRFVQTIAERYRGNITHYEIMNEPLFYLTPKAYAAYLRSASEILRSRNCKTVGLSLSTDFGSDADPWSREVFRLGTLNDSDTVSFHPYGARTLNSLTPADEYIAHLKSLLKQASGRKIPIWNTELYFVSNAPMNSAAAAEVTAHDAAIRFLTDLGEGVGQSISVTVNALFSPTLSVRQCGGNDVVATHPSPVFAAYNALARLFEAAKPVRKFKLPNDVVCYVFRKASTLRAAIWRYDGRETVSVKLPFREGEITLCDLFGNTRSPESVLKLDQAPFYLICRMGNEEIFLSRLENLNPEGENPVMFGDLRPVPCGNGKGFLLPLRNRLGIQEELLVELRAPGMTGRIRTELKAHEERTLTIPVRGDGLFPPETIQFSMLFHGRLLRKSLPVKPSPIASDQWNTLRMTAGKQKDLAAKFRRTTQDGKTVLEIHVSDTTPSASFGKLHWWDQDCVELFLDAEPQRIPLKHPTEYHGHVTRLFLLPRAPESERLQIWPGKDTRLRKTDFPCRFEFSPEGYTIRLTLPAFKNTDFIGFNIVVNDAEGEKRAERRCAWSSFDSYKDRLSFGSLPLKRP